MLKKSWQMLDLLDHLSERKFKVLICFTFGHDGTIIERGLFYSNILMNEKKGGLDRIFVTSVLKVMYRVEYLALNFHIE